MTDDQLQQVKTALRILRDSEHSHARPAELRLHMKTITEYLRSEGYGDTSVKYLNQLPDRLKVLIIQQHFKHERIGSHQTSYNEASVSRLLEAWFGIKIRNESGNSAQAIQQNNSLQNRKDGTQVRTIKFGDTEIFWYASRERDASTSRLLDTIRHEAALTTDATSPPCSIAEFVPRWLVRRDLEPKQYYLDEPTGHPIEEYFDQQRANVRQQLGIEIREASTEMAIIANGDGLRYHRDRLVNQYAHLESTGKPATNFRLVQDLTLIDWDMQAGTMSGTVLDHPNGDRYIFVLNPGEVVGLFFSEVPRFPGPMMMPYHCALPVIDRNGGRTIGAAKGKRLSTLVRGIADERELRALAGRSSQLRLNEVIQDDTEARSYVNGMRITSPATQTLQEPIKIIDDQEESISIIEMSTDCNRELLGTALRGNLNGARLFRVVKHSDGFSSMQAIPGFHTAEDVSIVNRCRRSPQAQVSYPVTLDFVDGGLPWLQLCAMRPDSIMAVPCSERSLIRLTPPAEILHRSALLDSFYATESISPRMANIVDVIVR